MQGRARGTRSDDETLGVKEYSQSLNIYNVRREDVVRAANIVDRPETPTSQSSEDLALVAFQRPQQRFVNLRRFLDGRSFGDKAAQMS